MLVSKSVRWLTICAFLSVAYAAGEARDENGLLNGLQEDAAATPLSKASWQVPVPLHRYYNTGSKNHFYTIHKNDIIDGKLIAWGFAYEGVEGKVYQNPAAGTVPLHRYYNGAIQDHFYTTNWGELGGGKSSYKYEGIECYVYPGPAEGLVPLFRYQSPTAKDHFYTTNWNELKDEGKGYKLESIQAYIFPKN